MLPVGGGDRRRQPDRLCRVDRLAGRNAARPVAGGGRARRLRPETTGLSAARDRICEFGAVRVRARAGRLVPVARQPEGRSSWPRGPTHRVARAGAAGRAVGVERSRTLPRLRRGFPARRAQRALRPALPRTAARPSPRSTPSEPPLCTAALARRLLEGRLRRVRLASLAHFFGVPTSPCHRALPDAEATAQVLVRLIGLAQEIGARRLWTCARWRRRASERSMKARTGPRCAHPSRRLPLSRPPRPGAVRRTRPRPAGAAGQLFPQRAPAPSVEAALLALDRSSGASSAPSSRPPSKSSA